jgi:hypothetical protein
MSRDHRVKHNSCAPNAGGARATLLLNHLQEKYAEDPHLNSNASDKLADVAITAKKNVLTLNIPVNYHLFKMQILKCKNELR